MRLVRVILSLSTTVIALAGVSAFGAAPPETSGPQPALPVVVATNGDGCLGADVWPEVGTASCPETALQADSVVTALDDFCLDVGNALAVEAATELACTQPAYDEPFPSTAKQICVDFFGPGDCFAGCCGPPGQVRKWVKCCADNGGACDPDCTAVCNPRYCR